MAKTKFGIVTSIDGLTAGVTVSGLDFSETVQQAEARNEKGQIIDMVGFSKRKTVNISGTMQQTASTLASAGSTITLDGKSWLITDVSRTESNTDFVQVSISATTADNAEITVLDTTTPQA